MSTAASIVSGTLDASGAGSYLLGLELSSTMGSDPSHGHDFVEEGVALSYTMKNPTLTFKDETVAVFATVPGGGSQTLVAPIVGPLAMQKLRDNFIDPTLTATLIVHISVTGHLEGGTHAATEAIDFPITVGDSNSSCASGFAPTGPCGTGGGLDGSPVVCE